MIVSRCILEERVDIKSITMEGCQKMVRWMGLANI